MERTVQLVVRARHVDAHFPANRITYETDVVNNIMEFDIETGEVTVVGSLAIPSIYGTVSVGNGEIYVWSGVCVDGEGDYAWDYDSINRLV